MLETLAAGLDRLPKRSQVAIFAACASALLHEADLWALLRGTTTAPLHRALRVAGEFALIGTHPDAPGLAALLEEVDEHLPHGESPDSVPATFAQDCWVCADSCIRIIVGDFAPGPCIEYALEPLLQSISTRLFGVADVGSGAHEDERLRAILAADELRGAIAFLAWASDSLRPAPPGSADELARLYARASVLAPPPEGPPPPPGTA